MRFIKKAAPNLSQEFKVYVPSKRLPLNEQKRMLAKQLHDFLHVYRKDTEQIRIEMSAQLDNERKKNKNKLINEKGFQSLLYRCTESELEEIMSVYMKNSQDSSVFLGASKSSTSKSSVPLITSKPAEKYEEADAANENKPSFDSFSTPQLVNTAPAQKEAFHRPSLPNSTNDSSQNNKSPKKASGKKSTKAKSPKKATNKPSGKKIADENANLRYFNFNFIIKHVFVLPKIGLGFKTIR